MPTFEELTEENMQRYTKFDDAVSEYAAFLIRDRQQTRKEVISIMSQIVKLTVIQMKESSIKKPEG